MTHPLSSVDINIFSLEISNFCYIEKYRQKLHFDAFVIITLLTFVVFLQVFLMNTIAILTISANLATPDLLSTKIFKGYNVIISVHNDIDKFFHVTQIML